MPAKTKSKNILTETSNRPAQKSQRPPVSRNFFGYAEEKWFSYGLVKVLMRTPTAKELKQRIRESRAAVKGLTRALTKRGLRISFKPTTPRFQSDPQNPKLVIRTVGKEQSRGSFIDGAFVEVTE